MKWPLQNKLNTYVDKVAGVITYAMNCRRDDAMSWCRFPGTSEFCDLGTGIAVEGSYWWESASIGVAVSGRKIFKVSSDGTKTEITGASLRLDSPVSFADFGEKLYMANGGRMVQWDASESTCSYLEDPDAPQNVTHVVVSGLYLLALDTNGIVWHSEVNEPHTWLGEFFNAESRPDKTVALAVDSDNVLLFGTRTVQPFYQTGDPLGPWAASPNATTNRGVGAAHSVSAEHIDLSYYFIDEDRKVLKLAGGQPAIVSDAITTELQDLSTVEDARGFHIRSNGETYYCLVFPTAGKAFAYDYRRGDWTGLGVWNDVDYGLPVFQCCDFFKGWNKHIAGGTDGKLYEIGTQFATGRFELRVKNSADFWTVCNELMIRCKRGFGTAAPKLLISYRDDGGEWRGERELSLGKDSDVSYYIRAQRFGRYRSREWRLVVSDESPVVIAMVEEL